MRATDLDVPEDRLVLIIGPQQLRVRNARQVENSQRRPFSEVRPSVCNGESHRITGSVVASRGYRRRGISDVDDVQTRIEIRDQSIVAQDFDVSPILRRARMSQPPPLT